MGYVSRKSVKKLCVLLHMLVCPPQKECGCICHDVICLDVLCLDVICHDTICHDGKCHDIIYHESYVMTS